MLKFNDNFLIENDMSSWKLTYLYEGKDKYGNPKQQEKQTWHATLIQVANKIVDYEAKECVSMVQLVTLLDGRADAIKVKIQGLEE